MHGWQEGGEVWIMFSESLVSFYEDDVVSEFFLKSSDAFEAAIKGYNTSSIAKLLDRRRRAVESDLFDEPEEIGLSVAKTYREREEAEELVYRQYSARGFSVAEPGSQPRVARQDARRESVIIARIGRRAIGTMTVGIDSPNGLLVDDANREAVDPLRAQGLRLGEVVRFALDGQVDSRRVLASLFNAAHGIMEANRLHHVFIEVNPRHVAFYRRAFCFSVAGEEKCCPRVGAPSVLLRMCVAEFTSKIGQLEKALAEFPLN
jgi:hypothetical protein